MILDGGRKKTKIKSKRKKKTKARPPRIFVSKGKLYIRIGKKKYLLQDQQDYTKKELLDIIFKELLVRRKRRKRGKYTKREKKLDEEEKKTFESFERLNRSKSSVRGLSIPSSIKLRDRTSSSSLFNSVVPWSQTAIQPLVPQIDLNLQTQKIIEAERKKQIELKKEDKKKQLQIKAKDLLQIEEKKNQTPEEKKQASVLKRAYDWFFTSTPQTETKTETKELKGITPDYPEEDKIKVLILKARGEEISKRLQEEYRELETKYKSVIRNEYYEFFEDEVRRLGLGIEDDDLDLKLSQTSKPHVNFNKIFNYLFRIDRVKNLEKFLNNKMPSVNQFLRLAKPQIERKRQELEPAQPDTTLQKPNLQPIPERKRQPTKTEKELLNEKVMRLRITKEDAVNQMKYLYDRLDIKSKKILKQKYYDFFKGLEADIRKEEDPNINLNIRKSYTPMKNYENTFSYLVRLGLKMGSFDIIDQFTQFRLPPIMKQVEEEENPVIVEEVKEEKEGKAIEPETQTEAEQVRGEIIQQASGYYKGDGLNTSEINNIMKYHKNYVGCFPSNFNKYLPKKLPNPCGFVMNLDNDKKKGSHWVAVYIDKDSSIEYYDSFGKEPSKDFMKRLNKLISKLKPHTYLKMKINKIKEQNVKSNNCGFFACKFLIDRFNNKPFKECSGYDDSVKGEKDIKKLINKYPTFNYI
jgi:hypothetical protein